jgi:predicted nucleotidyltransferase
MAKIKMTRSEFVKNLTDLLKESYPDVTEKILSDYLDLILKGEKPNNIMALFIYQNLEKIEIIKEGVE